MMTATRSVVSYDDITLPYDPPDERQPQASSSSHNTHYHNPPPSKKRKKNNQKAKQHRSASNSTSQHAEFLKSTGASSKQPPEEEQWDADANEGEHGYDEEGGEVEESRELTHEEIWDDSALVNAWEAATEEYEAYHGPDKGWKKEPVNKSPLWYNVPVNLSTSAEKAGGSSSTNIPSGIAASVPAVHDDDAEPDSQPLNFDTFVPTYDPSLNILSDPTSNQIPVPDTNYIPAAGESVVSQDEAFSRALSAMYWGGYWTAMYHAQRQLPTQSTASNALKVTAGTAEEEEEDEDLEHGEEIEVDDDDYTSTQR